MSLIETVTGKLVNVDCPNPETVDLNDAAWAISRISRFAGHTITEIPLNVAQHSIHVAEMIVEHEDRPDVYQLAMFGLLHDTAEGFIGDIPSPVKHLPALKAELDRIENRLLWIIFEKYVGKQPTDEQWSVVKKYDKKAVLIESYHFIPSRGRNWPGADQYVLGLVELQTYPEPMSAIESYQKFLQKYDQLKSVTESST